jgi:Flp pilus assembly protein TadD
MQTPSSPQVAQQKDVPPPPPPAPAKAAPQVPPAKQPEVPGKEEFPKFVMEPPKSDVTDLPKLDKRPRQGASGPDMRAAKTKPDGEPQKPAPKPEKAEGPVSPVVPMAPAPDSTVIVQKMTSERITTNYNNALRAAEQGKTEEARKLYMAVLVDQPDNIEALNNLGVLAMRENNTKEALFYFRRILEYRKDYAKAYNNLGIIMLRERETKIAEEYFRKAIEVAPEGIEPYLNLVALMRSEKRLDEANRLLDVLLRKGQRGGQVFLSAALIKDDMGQYDDAIKYYRYYLQTSPQNQDRRKVVERLSFLEESQSAAGR